jgi:hypothetical protein
MGFGFSTKTGTAEPKRDYGAYKLLQSFPVSYSYTRACA